MHGRSVPAGAGRLSFLGAAVLTPEHVKLLEYAVYGGLSALVGSMTKSRSLTLPRLVTYHEKNGQVKKIWDPGLLVAPFGGAIIAAIVDGRPQTALAYGVAVGFAGPAVFSVLSDAVIKRLGYVLGGLPENSLPAPTNGGKS